MCSPGIDSSLYSEMTTLLNQLEVHCSKHLFSHNQVTFVIFPTAGPKGNEDQKRLAVHYTTSQHYQENVFIEGSRPQYLEDLHTEAQEGLKILQQEGQTNSAGLYMYSYK